MFSTDGWEVFWNPNPLPEPVGPQPVAPQPVAKQKYEKTKGNKCVPHKSIKNQREINVPRTEV